MKAVNEMIETANDSSRFEGWCIVEQMGHRRLTGYAVEVEIAGVGMIRLDIPGLSTVFIHPQSLYAITPTTEEVARELAAQAPQPLTTWDVRALLPDIKEEVKRDIYHEVATEYREELDRRNRRLPTVEHDDYDEDEIPAF